MTSVYLVNTLAVLWFFYSVVEQIFCEDAEMIWASLREEVAVFAKATVDNKDLMRVLAIGDGVGFRQKLPILRAKET